MYLLVRLIIKVFMERPHVKNSSIGAGRRGIRRRRRIGIRGRMTK